MKKILITGAAGSVGLATLKKLLLIPNLEITATDLPNKKTIHRLKPFKDNVKINYGSINDKDFIDKLVKDQDIIIHLAAIIPPLADKKPELTREVNYFGTKNIVDAIKKYQRGFLIYSSSVSVYGDRIKNPWISVDDPLKPSEGDYYAYVKIETENMIRESHIPYTIFRLTGIMDHPVLDPLMFHMPLDTKIEIASVNDAGRAFANATLYTDKLNKKTFNLGGGEKCRTTYKDFITNMFKIYGIKVKYLKEYAFAEKNFHCGFFTDSYKLNNILNFQEDTLDSYYNTVKNETKKATRFFSKIFSQPIVYFLNKKSEPLIAKKKHDNNLIKRFFN